MWNSNNRISLSTKKKKKVKNTNAKSRLSCSNKDTDKKSFQTYPTQDAEYLHWVVNTGFIIFCNSSKKPTYRKNTFNITIE